MPPPPQETSQKSRKPGSSRGRPPSRLGTPSPLRVGASNVYSPLARAAEGKSDDDTDHSHDPVEPAEAPVTAAVPIGHGGTNAPTMAEMQQADPGGVFIPLTHRNYSSFLKRHLQAQSSGLRLPSNSFTWFLPSDGQLLSREAAGLQTYVYSGQPPSDTAFTKIQSDILDQLSAIHGFDVHLFANLVIPEDALTSPVVVAVRDLFNEQMKSRVKYLRGNFQSTINASQHQLDPHSVPVRTNFFDGSGGGYLRAPSGGYQNVSGGGYSSGSGGPPPQISGGGYQGSSQPPSQQSSHSGKLLLGAADGVPWC